MWPNWKLQLADEDGFLCCAFRKHLASSADRPCFLSQSRRVANEKELI